MGDDIEKPAASGLFRPNAAGVIFNDDGNVLVGERRDWPNQFQFPQGGVEEGEDPREALFREIEEETGIPRERLLWLHSLDQPLRYTLPKEKVYEGKLYVGQEQYWSLLYLSKPIGIDDKASKEFRRLLWVDFPWIIERVVWFKRNIYERVYREFDPIIRSYLAGG